MSQNYDNMRGCGTFIVAVIGFVVGVTLAGFTAYEYCNTTWEREAIKRGYAEFNPRTAAFQWKENR